MRDTMTPWAEDDIAQLRYHLDEYAAAKAAQEADIASMNASRDKACVCCGYLVCSKGDTYGAPALDPKALARAVEVMEAYHAGKHSVHKRVPEWQRLCDGVDAFGMEAHGNAVDAWIRNETGHTATLFTVGGARVLGLRDGPVPLPWEAEVIGWTCDNLWRAAVAVRDQWREANLCQGCNHVDTRCVCAV